MEKQPLLLIIDLQKGWRHETATEEAMLNTVKLAQKFNGDIIHCRFINDESSLFYTSLRWDRFFTADDTAEIPEIEALRLPTYWRSTYSCVNEETLPLFRAARKVYICGVFTDVSVTATAMGIFDVNVPVSVVSDCVASLHGEQSHIAELRSLESIIGAINLPTAAGVLADLSAE
ncbi:MAG TPA: isochorismatase family protein [Candidatus Microsaccharimonas sp.]|nr:isochorismatase family protein [Candidatus Microsaccharimonas sp.]